MFNFLTIDKVSSSLVACGAVALSFFYIFGREKFTSFHENSFFTLIVSEVVDMC